MTPPHRWNHRKSATERGYGVEHKRLRAILLATEPLCRICKSKGRTTAATIADHIKPIAKGGPTTLENLQPLCRPCSDRKTLLDRGARPRPTIGPDGWPID